MLELIGPAVKQAAPVAEHLNLLALSKAGQGMAKVARSCLGLADEGSAIAAKSGLEVAVTRAAVGRGIESAATGLPELSVKPGLLQLARIAGAQKHFEGQALEVFAHGTTGGEVSAFVKSQGKNLSEHGGNFGGRLFTAVDLEVATEFAGRTAMKFGGEPRLLGIALPRNVAESLQSARIMRTGRIDDRLGLQTIFEPGAMRTLRSKGFFFDMTSALEEASKAL